MLPGNIGSDILSLFKVVVWLLVGGFIKKYSIFILSDFLAILFVPWG